MRKIERRNDPGEPLDYLDIKKGAGHTHIVDTENANGIKTQKPVRMNRRGNQSVLPPLPEPDHDPPLGIH